MLRKGMYLANRYEILEQIGTGGMSDVYSAKCHKLNRNVAIKVLKREFSEDKNFVAKFRAEAQSAACLTHPNIVNVYDVGDENGIYFIVMELVEGITLKKYIEKKGRIPYREAISIAIQVAKGMEAAHNHNIIHRDIKPQNVIISKDGKVKVTDFGIAKAASTSTINSSAAMGSVHYISPEQARGGYSDAKGDIYSFGITLFEMITGTVPFDGDSTVSVAVQHIQDDIPLPSSFVEGLPVSVDSIILKCAQKKTEKRYASASDLITDLKTALVRPDDDFVVLDNGHKPESALPAETESKEAEDISEELLTEEPVKTVAPVKPAKHRESEEIELDELLDETPKKSEPRRDINDYLLEDDDDDYDDYYEGGSKFDTAFKCIGLGIVALIVIVTLFVAAKLFLGDGFGGATEQPTTTVEEEVTTIDEYKDKVMVPNLIGKTESEAKVELNAISLGYKAVKQSSTTIPAGYVISQGTIEGTYVDKNTTVTLSISSGPDSVAVPMVIGLEQIEGTELLEEAGFLVTVEKAASDTVEAGTIMKQNPSAKSNVAYGVTVKITVSDGMNGASAETTTVPNVVRYELNAAITDLKAAKLKVKVEYKASATGVEDGVVFAQNREAGAVVPVNTEVVIQVKGKEPATTKASTTTATTKASATAATTKASAN